MAQNQIRIDDEAYRRLNGLKTKQGETFNDAVHKLLDFHDKNSEVVGIHD